MNETRIWNLKNKPTLQERLDALQEEAVQAAMRSLLEFNRALVVLPTGSGKTNTGIKIVKRFNTSKKVLWLTHKIDLLEDAFALFTSEFPKSKVAIFRGMASVADADFLIATIQSISKKDSLPELDPKDFGLVIVDEGHHAPAKSYKRLLSQLDAVPHVGMTATHLRPDREDLEPIFGPPCIHMNVRSAIEERIYANPETDSRCILTNSKINGVVSAYGEYTPSDLDRLVVSENRNQIILDAYLKYGRGPILERGQKPKAIGFAINVRHAIRMAKLFQNAGIPSTYVAGSALEMSVEERRETLLKFKATNEIEVLWAVDLLNEGSNYPDVNCLLMGRPTRSNIIYCQQLGRAARWVDGRKERFAVLDFADVTRKGFENYLASNITGYAYTGKHIITEYVTTSDPIKLDERVSAIQKILDFEFAREQFYPTKEEAYEACRRLGIASQSQYKERYREDSRLPSQPGYVYPGWSFTVLSGVTPPNSDGNKQAIKDFFEKHGRFPSSTAKGLAELKLGRALREYCSPSSSSYDSEFRKWAETKGYGTGGGKAKKVRNLTTGEVFESGRAASKRVKLTPGAISQAIRGKKRAGGHYWEHVYVEEA